MRLQWRSEKGVWTFNPINMKKYSLLCPNLEFNIEFNTHFLALGCSWKWVNDLWLNYWLDFATITNHSEYFQLSLYKNFSTIHNKSSYSLLRKFLRILKSRFKYQNQSVAWIICFFIIIIIIIIIIISP